MVEETKAQAKVLNLLLTGANNKQIATELNIQEQAVKFHLTNLFKKYNVKSRTELVVLKLNKRD